MDGKSVFLTGSPGAGKTYVLNQFITQAEQKGKRVAVTASTGIAATHIGGTTIHSWSGLGIRDELSPRDLTWLGGNEKLIKRYNTTDVLVIDEVSMLHGKRLDMINEAAKLLRESEESFGGLQVILVGDLFQLPPVNRSTSLTAGREQEADDFVHLSLAWQELNPTICYLLEQHRQTGGGLLEVLEAMRSNSLEDYHEGLLAERLGEQADEMTITRLYAHNADVDMINQEKLRELEGEQHRYQMRTSGAQAKVEQLTRGILAPEELILTEGAEVMFVANNFTKGFVNGTRGRVVGFKDDLPIIELEGGKRRVAVEPNSWTLEEDGKQRAEASQLPLRLAWAITIHKSQGMSLDSAEIDLSRSFTPGMGYVALSRVRSLEGLYLSGINRMALELHPLIYELDQDLRQRSADVAGSTDDFIPEEPKKRTSEDQSELSTQQVELFESLKAWRYSQAQAKKLPAYMIAHNKALEAIARTQPTTTRQLLGVNGIGAKFVDNYGDDILKMISEKLGIVTVPEAGKAAQLDDFLDKRNIKLSKADREELKHLL